jgi:hypothetical protein
LRGEKSDKAKESSIAWLAARVPKKKTFGCDFFPISPY